MYSTGNVPTHQYSGHYYYYYSCIKGTLIEMNETLLTNPQLLVEEVIWSDIIITSLLHNSP